MENINDLLGKNLRNFREEKKLSLDKVAELTGVSKAMLGQIERGESSPTITTVWKIANGLKISFSALIQEPQLDTVLISKNGIQPLVEDEGRYRVYPLFPFETDRRFEVFSVDMEKGALLNSEAHMEGTQEFVTVFDGELAISLNENRYILKNGDSIRFRADVPHVYHNAGDEPVRMSMVIYYPE